MIFFKITGALSSIWWIWDAFDLIFPIGLVGAVGLIAIRPSAANNLLRVIVQGAEDSNDHAEDDGVQLELIPIASLDAEMSSLR